MLKTYTRNKPIVIPLDRVQRHSTTLINDEVEVWKELRKSVIYDNNDKKIRQQFEKTVKMSLTPAHFLASSTDAGFRGES